MKSCAASWFSFQFEESGLQRRVVARDNLGEDLAAEAGDVRGLTTAVGAGHGLAADDVERVPDDGMTVAESVVAGVLMEKAGQLTELRLRSRSFL
jgi:hypothetical protein